MGVRDSALMWQRAIIDYLAIYILIIFWPWMDNKVVKFQLLPGAPRVKENSAHYHPFPSEDEPAACHWSHYQLAVCAIVALASRLFTLLTQRNGLLLRRHVSPLCAHFTVCQFTRT